MIVHQFAVDRSADTGQNQTLRLIALFHASVLSPDCPGSTGLILLHLHALVNVKRGDGCLSGQHADDALNPLFAHRHELATLPAQHMDFDKKLYPRSSTNARGPPCIPLRRSLQKSQTEKANLCSKYLFRGPQLPRQKLKPTSALVN